MSTKELLAMQLRQLAGVAQAYVDVTWRETHVGNDVVNLHTEAERSVHRMLVATIGQANGALLAASNTADNEEEDGLEIPD